MAAINFPNSPSNGDTHTANGVTYEFNASKSRWFITDYDAPTGPTGPSGPGGGIQSNSDSQLNSLGVGTGASGTAGEIRATNNITAYYSDGRLKDVLGEIDNALSKVKELRGVYFEENETAKSLGYNNDKRQVGVIAQEVQKVLPEVVTEAPIDDKYITVWYDKLIPLLIEAIKELSAKVDKLEGK